MANKLVKFVVIWLVLAVLSRSVLGLQSRVMAEAAQEEFWNGTGAVIIGKVSKVSVQSPAVYYELEMEPIACIAGLLNVAEHPSMTVLYGTGQQNVPLADDLVLIAVYDRVKLLARVGAIPEGPRFYVPAAFDAMRDGQPLIVLKGMDDAVVYDVLQKIRAARRPTTAPTTVPAK